MSAIGYGVLTRLRGEADENQSQTTNPPSMKVFMDGLAAVVPGEILVLHGLVVAGATETVTTQEKGVDKVTSTFDASSVPPVAFWILVGACVPVYVIARLWGGSKWKGSDWLRMCLPSCAFIAWTMLGKGTMADAAFGTMNSSLRLSLAGALGLLVTGLAIYLGKRMEEQTAVAPDPSKLFGQIEQKVSGAWAIVCSIRPWLASQLSTPR